MADKKRRAAIIAAVILGCAALLYLGGMLGQLLENYIAWMAADGFSGQTEMQSVNWNPLVCFPQAFTVNGLKGMLGIILAGGGIVLYVRLHDKFDGKTYDPRGFKTSKSGAYGTASWMEEKEMKEVLEVAAPAKAEGVILGEYKGSAVCMPKDTRLNRHIAIFGASGTMKSRAIIRNALFQALKRQESVVITDPKGELYSDTAELYRQNGYEVKVFNLVNPEHGDSWNCMSDLNGDTLMAQVLTNVIIGNTSSGKGDHFWDNGEGGLLKALILLVDQDRSRSPEMKLYQPAAQKDGEADKVAKLQTKHQQLQNQMLLLQATGTDSAGATAETRKVVEAELEKVTAELRSIKGSSVQAVEHVSAELKVAKPRMDEYVPEEITEPSGRYFLGKDVDGKPQIYFDDLAQAENTSKKPEDLPDKNVESCTVNTDKVDREIEKLKRQKRELEQQIDRETDETKVKNLKAKLTQIERELNQKDNDTYKRQHATYTFS